ncbi:MAG: DegT/DnrJ/EryC1/StrS family aminotransferase [bacterium]|nr:DegT/DnrJ/EryC1/StrS family aminotransferase [bacterium]
MKAQKIKLFDLKKEYEEIGQEILEEIRKVLESGIFIMGKNVEQLEQELANYFNVKYAITVNSGTDALLISLKALGIREGDEVITTPFTFFATAEVISNLKAVPVFVDIDDNFNIDVNLIEKSITDKTKAIIPVHLFGLPVNMEKIMEIAKKYNLYVIEDVAQAFGAKYKGRLVGTFGDFGAFSCFPTKNLGAYGDAGFILTNDQELYKKSKMLKVHGSIKKYYHEEFGYNSRMDEIQAAILKVKLKYIEKFNNHRIKAANLYNTILSKNPYITTPKASDEFYHVYHQYTIKVNDNSPIDRDTLKKELELNGIETNIYYPYPLHKLPVYLNKDNYKVYHSLVRAEELCNKVLSLPMYHYISLDDVEYVANTINRIFNV